MQDKRTSSPVDFCLKASTEYLHSPRSAGQKQETGRFQKQDFAFK